MRDSSLGRSQPPAGAMSEAPPASVELPAGDEAADERRCRFCGRRGEKRKGSGRRGRASTPFVRCVRTQPQKRRAGQTGKISDGSPSPKFFGASIFIKSNSGHQKFQLFRTSCWSCEACDVQTEGSRLDPNIDSTCTSS